MTLHDDDTIIINDETDVVVIGVGVQLGDL